MSLKLLVADDSITIQKMVSLAFSGEDVSIEAVSDGNSALESAKCSKPDVVLADVFMPGCSGYEVCARIKENPELSSVPVILLVGAFEPFDELEAARVKCDGYLVKPFDTSELIQAVQAKVSKPAIPEASDATDQVALKYSTVRPSYLSTRALVSPAAWDSFVGDARILDLFDPELLAASASAENALLDVVQTASEPEVHLSENSLNLIVDKVVRKISTDVIREVAWEVVPELSETIIRDTLQQRQKSS